MIGVLRGEVVVRRPDHVVLLCGGVGYRAAVSAQTLHHVPAAGEETMLHTHLIVRDDALTLYGFHSESERDLFLMLLSVQAVGPKVALAVLSGGPARELIGAIAAATRRGFRPCPGSASAPRSGSSSSCARRSSACRDPRATGTSSVPGAGTAHAGSRATGCWSSATRRARSRSCCATPTADMSAEELIAHALRVARTG